ncbi:ABC transporter ATP-binding protein [Paenibacillus glucanolyticus]|uniref:ABC transporter ATP-binding protein n=1 Tax=Paenibacillus TaxID=44249 RepID=UPI001163555C|nr:ABC transporter ATP-binding protein [Paenibacillus sp. Cedars]AWP25770.1 ABC transporter ATP-binding protein [Paenibacillus sp. Cedars]
MTEKLLSIHELTKSIGSITPVKGISFDLKRGGCTALLGPNGAGKTTTLRMLAGLIPPTRGEIKHGSADKQTNDWRHRIGYLPQYPKFYSWMSGKEYLSFSAKLSGLSGQKALQRSQEVIEMVGLQQASKRRISGYSGGMKQRLGIAQALVHEPELIMLDEPVSALDPIGRREVMDLLNRLRGEVTILFSTHVLHDAEEICDDMVLMVDGEIAEKGALSELRSKYRQPVLSIEVEPGERELAWLHGLSKRSFVQEAEVGKHRAKLTVTDMGAARAVLIKELADNGIELLRFEAGTSSLEDMFMKVVGP